MKKIILLCFLFSQGVTASVSVLGNAPLFEYPGLESKIDKIWQYEKNKYLLGKNVEEPEVYFFPFDRTQESQDWITWQNNWIRLNPSIWAEWAKVAGSGIPSPVTDAWIDQNINRVFPFPKGFRAFHYDKSNKIQIDPVTTFLPFYVNDPSGVKVDNVGFGYYTTAHELLHYTLEQRGIPLKIHHCLFITDRAGRQTLMEDAAQFLIDQKISNSFVMFMGADKEILLKPCEKLTPEEITQVQGYASSLP